MCFFTKSFLCTNYEHLSFSELGITSVHVICHLMDNNKSCIIHAFGSLSLEYMYIAKLVVAWL